MFVLLFGITLTDAQSIAQTSENTPEYEMMKQYFFVLLTKGPDRSQDSTMAATIQQEHLENISRLCDEGKLDIAGPFLDDSDWRGMFIFNVESENELKALLDTDPAIRSGRLSFIIHPLYARKGSILR